MTKPEHSKTKFYLILPDGTQIDITDNVVDRDVIDRVTETTKIGFDLLKGLLNGVYQAIKITHHHGIVLKYVKNRLTKN